MSAYSRSSTRSRRADANNCLGCSEYRADGESMAHLRSDCWDSGHANGRNPTECPCKYLERKPENWFPPGHPKRISGGASFDLRSIFGSPSSSDDQLERQIRQAVDTAYPGADPEVKRQAVQYALTKARAQPTSQLLADFASAGAPFAPPPAGPAFPTGTPALPTGHAPASSTFGTAPPPAPPSQYPLEGFPLTSTSPAWPWELKQANHAGMIQSLEISRTMMNSLLTAAGRSTGGKLDHVDVTLSLPVTGTFTWMVCAYLSSSATAPTSISAARSVTGATTRSNDRAPMVLKLASPSDLSASVWLHVAVSMAGFSTSTASSAPSFGFITPEVGLIA